MAKLPQWSTPERRQHLAMLYERSKGGCIFGDADCDIDDHHWHEARDTLQCPVVEGIIDSWKAEDRERRSFEWKLEQRAILDGTFGRYGTSFDPVARDVFMNERPEYYLVAMGVNPFTYKRVALIRIPSTYVHLFVDVAGTVQGVSKNAIRKAKRYGKTKVLTATIEERCKAAVREWWGTRN